MLSFGIISQSALIKAAEINYTIIQRINREAAAELSSELLNKNIKIGKVNLSAHSSKDYLESEMLNSLISNKLLDTSSRNYISIEIFDNNVYYQLYESDSDSLIRLNKFFIVAKTFNESAALLDFRQIEKIIFRLMSLLLLNLFLLLKKQVSGKQLLHRF